MEPAALAGRTKGEEVVPRRHWYPTLRKGVLQVEESIQEREKEKETKPEEGVLLQNCSLTPAGSQRLISAAREAYTKKLCGAQETA